MNKKNKMYLARAIIVFFAFAEGLDSFVRIGKHLLVSDSSEPIMGMIIATVSGIAAMAGWYLILSWAFEHRKRV